MFYLEFVAVLQPPLFGGMGEIVGEWSNENLIRIQKNKNICGSGAKGIVARGKNKMFGVKPKEKVVVGAGPKEE